MVKCILHLETPTKQPGSSRILYSLKVFLKKEGKTRHFQVTERSQLLIEAWGFWVFWLQPGAGQEPTQGHLSKQEMLVVPGHLRNERGFGHSVPGTGVWRTNIYISYFTNSSENVTTFEQHGS